MRPYLESEYHGIEAGYYDKVYRRGRGVQWFWHHHRFAMVDALLPPATRRLLDLGCGPGTYLGRLDRPGVACVGIDLAGAQIEYAARTYTRPGLVYRAADVRELGDADGRFDAVVAIELVEHLQPADAHALLARARDLLEPGGVLILTTPNYRSLWPAIELLVSALGPVDYRAQHINPYTLDRLAREVAAAGLEVETALSFFVVAPFLAPLSARLAARVLAAERRWPRAGAEIALRARRPR